MNKDTFCILPWIHMMVWSNGSVSACCEQGGTSLGNFQKNTYETINLDKFKKLRKDLYTGKKHKFCNKCWIAEDKNLKSYRQKFNELYASNINKEFLDSLTDYDNFSLNDKFKIRYLDIRSSNLCNYKCRMCGINSSSSWWQFIKDSNNHLVKKFKSQSNFNDKTGIIEFNIDLMELKKHIPYIRVVNLAGGEPVMLSGTYKLLEEFIKQNKKDTVWNLISNTSKLVYGKKNILDLLSYFDLFRWKMSLDAIGDAHSYLRSDTADWNTVYDNSQKLLKYKNSNNNMELDIHSSVTWIGVYRFYDVWKMYHNDVDSFTMNPVIGPEELSIESLPDEDLINIVNFYKKKILENKNKKNINSLEKLLIYVQATLNKKRKNINIKKAVQLQIEWDKQRNTNLFNTFPEWNHFKVYAN